jgi:hypothetical protein
MTPKGQRYLQKGRYTMIDRKMRRIRIMVFQAKRKPNEARIPSLNIDSGQPAISVPAGQIHLQNPG